MSALLANDVFAVCQSPDIPAEISLPPVHQRNPQISQHRIVVIHDSDKDIMSCLPLLACILGKQYNITVE